MERGQRIDTPSGEVKIFISRRAEDDLLSGYHFDEKQELEVGGAIRDGLEGK